MISAAIPSHTPKYIYLSDRPYAETIWLSDLQYKVAQATGFAEDSDIALVACKTDSSSAYLDEIVQWEALRFNLSVPVHATQIREKYFTYDVGYKEFLAPAVVDHLEAFRKTDDFKTLKDEFDFISDYKAEWVGAPHIPVFVCTDVVCIRSGHVLLVRRKHSPGKGLWAFPGGFLGQNELVIDSAIRELKEETSIALTKSELKKAITESRVFDSVGRSLRGRTISHAYCINLGSGKLDRIRANDDAIDTRWFPVDEALSMEEEMFEDHHAILQFFINRA